MVLSCLSTADLWRKARLLISCAKFKLERDNVYEIVNKYAVLMHFIEFIIHSER